MTQRVHRAECHEIISAEDGIGDRTNAIEAQDRFVSTIVMIVSINLLNLRKSMSAKSRLISPQAFVACVTASGSGDVTKGLRSSLNE